MPGLVNAHQHLTGDRLARSTIPDGSRRPGDLRLGGPAARRPHARRRGALGATLGLVDAATNGITFTVEAGTVGHPERVLAAYDRVGVGGTLGSWGSDAAELPFAGDVAAVLDRQRQVLELTGRTSPRRRLGDARRSRPDVRRAGRGRQPVGCRHRHRSDLSSVTDRRRSVGVPRSNRSPPHRAPRRPRCARPPRADRPWRAPRRRRTGHAAAHEPRWPTAHGPTCVSGRALPAPGVMPSSTNEADGWRWGATPRTPEMPSTCCAPRPSPSGSPATPEPHSTTGAPTPPSNWRRSVAPKRSAWTPNSARWRSANVPTSCVVDTTGPGWAPPSADPVLGLIWGGGRRRSPTSSPAVRSSSAMAAVSASTSTDFGRRPRRRVERLLHDAGLDPQPRWPLR